MVEVEERRRDPERLVYALRPRPPYAFAHALTALHYSPSVVLDSADPASGVYHRALRLADHDALVLLRSTGTLEQPELELAVRGAELNDAVAAAALDYARRVFRLDVDPAPFAALLEDDPILADFVGQFPGLRPILIADPFEALVFAIIGQQINVSFARTLKQRLVSQYGRTLAVDGVRYPLFPETRVLAALEPADLLAQQFSRQKAAYTIGLARAVEAGELDLPAIGALPFEEAMAALTRHKGIGRWTAEYVLMRGFGADDSIPAGDLGLRDVIGKAYLGRRASEAEVREIAERWHGFRGWAAFYWWFAIHLSSRRPE